MSSAWSPPWHTLEPRGQWRRRRPGAFRGRGPRVTRRPLAGQVVSLTQPLFPPLFSGLRDTQAVPRAALGTHAQRKAGRRWERCLCSSTVCVKCPEHRGWARHRLESSEEAGWECCFWGWKHSSTAQVRSHPLPMSALTRGLRRLQSERMGVGGVPGASGHWCPPCAQAAW